MATGGYMFGGGGGGGAGGMDMGTVGGPGAGGSAGGMDWMSMLSKMMGGQQQQAQQGGDQWDIPAQKANPNDMFNKAVSNYTMGIVKFGKDAGGGQARSAPKLPPPQPFLPAGAMESMQQPDALTRLLQVYQGGAG